MKLLKPLVFTPEWIQTLQKRYGHRPRPLRSVSYLIATDPQFDLIRQQIEKWVAGLPQANQRRIIQNLRERDFWHTYHELVTGSFLKELGLLIEFERKLGEQTPDWFTCSKDGLQRIIIETFTVNVSKRNDSENKQLDDLTRRLAEIPLDFAVKISCEDNSAIKQLDSKRSKQIAKAVRLWLQTYNLLSEPRFCMWGFTFQIIQRGRGYETLQYASPAKPLYAAWMPLRAKINEKIYKYKNLVISNKISLVIAVAPGPGTD